MPTVQTIVTLDETEANTLAQGLGAPAEAVKIDVRAHLARLKQALPSMKSFKNGLQVDTATAEQCRHALEQERDLLSQVQTLIGETPHIQEKLDQIESALGVCADIRQSNNTHDRVPTAAAEDAGGWSADPAA